jgi:hypothetical protein
MTIVWVMARRPSKHLQHVVERPVVLWQTERVSHLELELASKTASTDVSQEEVVTLRARLQAAVRCQGS